jgi:hypothetical protein
MPPSMGRIVLFTFHPSTGDDLEVAPAMITKVRSNTRVALYVMGETSAWHEHEAELAEDPGKVAGSWAWPPRV